MFSTKLPAINASRAVARTENSVIAVETSAGYYHPSHKAPFLFVTHFQNSGQYKVANHRLNIGSRNFLLVRAGDEVEVEYQKGTNVETLMILFGEKFFMDGLRYCSTDPNRLLDEPTLSTIEDWPSEVPHVCNKSILALATKARKLRASPQQEIDNVLLELIPHVLIQHLFTRKQVMKVGALKRSTKEELYRRLTAVVEFMHGNVHEALTLDDMASVACLNKFHFIDSFKSLYDVAPAQYFRELKLQRAMKFLRKGIPVNEVCHILAFDSVGSFSNLFKKRFGTPPSKVNC